MGLFSKDPNTLFEKGWDEEHAGNNAKAIKLYEKAAAQGLAKAQVACGRLWMYEAEYDKARTWMEKAAAQTKDKNSQKEAQDWLDTMLF